MDPISLLGNAQNAYTAGLQKQAVAQADAVRGVPKRGTPDATPDMKKVHETAEKFEAFFVGQMMEHMMAGIESDPMFGGGHGEDMWKSMLNQEYGKEIAKSGKLGIADHVMRGMLQAQEQRTAAATALAAVPQAPAATDTTAVTAQDAAVATVAGARNLQAPRR
jgi:flagellar protein FlgJ